MFKSRKQLLTYLAETPQVDCDVYYSPITNKIKLAFYPGGHSIDFVNSKGNVWTESRRLTKTYIKIGRLVGKK